MVRLMSRLLPLFFVLVLSGPATAENDGPTPFSDTERQIQEVFGAQLAGCWDLDLEIAGPIDYVIALRIPLGPDGWMSGEPALNYDWDDPVLKDPVFQDLAASTINVLHACQPYVLPADLYEGEDGWNQIEVVLAPELLSAP